MALPRIRNLRHLHRRQRRDQRRQGDRLARLPSRHGFRRRQIVRCGVVAGGGAVEFARESNGGAAGSGADRHPFPFRFQGKGRMDGNAHPSLHRRRSVLDGLLPLFQLPPRKSEGDDARHATVLRERRDVAVPRDPPGARRAERADRGIAIQAGRAVGEAGRHARFGAGAEGRYRGRKIARGRHRVGHPPVRELVGGCGREAELHVARGEIVGAVRGRLVAAEQPRRGRGAGSVFEIELRRGRG
mmetsp:Transcript_16686/g.28705  ORF Transcript_16686/g.28705 Transcript_16686/m.28705 type:complete len:244 (-) Transcript_16686:518-1249(-)